MRWSSRAAGFAVLVFLCLLVTIAALGIAGQLPGQIPLTPKPTNIQLPTL